MRELLGKNKSRSDSEKVSVKAIIESSENARLPRTTATCGAESQLGSILEPGERILNVVGENVNEVGERGAGVETMGQDSSLEECNLEFQIIERQL